MKKFWMMGGAVIAVSISRDGVEHGAGPLVGKTAEQGAVGICDQSARRVDPAQNGTGSDSVDADSRAEVASPAARRFPVPGPGCCCADRGSRNVCRNRRSGDANSDPGLPRYAGRIARPPLLSGNPAGPGPSARAGSGRCSGAPSNGIAARGAQVTGIGSVLPKRIDVAPMSEVATAEPPAVTRTFAEPQRQFKAERKTRRVQRERRTNDVVYRSERRAPRYSTPYNLETLRARAPEIAAAIARYM